MYLLFKSACFTGVLFYSIIISYRLNKSCGSPYIFVPKYRESNSNFTYKLLFDIREGRVSLVKSAYQKFKILDVKPYLHFSISIKMYVISFADVSWLVP